MHQRVFIECVSFNYGRPPGPTPVIDKSGIFSTAHGLRIACLGGAYAPEKYYGKTNGAVSNHASSYIYFLLYQFTRTSPIHISPLPR